MALSFAPAALAGRPTTVKGSRKPKLVRPALVWGVLTLNLLTYIPSPTVVPIPGPIGQAITQGALPLALVLALVLNPGGVFRPTMVMVLYTLMAVVALMVSLHNEFLFGSVFRAVRLVEFVAVLWLLTPWWGRSDLTILKCHLKVLKIVLATVLVGAILAPGKAFSFDGRLTGTIWPIPAPQVAHYAAVVTGCTLILWMGGRLTGRQTWPVVVICFGLLIATHTRTGLTGMIAGLVFAGGSLFIGRARVRKASLTVVVSAVLGGALLGPFIVKWALRGQDAQQASQLTGRTKVWTSVSHLQRPFLNTLFGSGLSNKSFDGLPIDSNWLATYFDLGWFGVTLDVVLLLFLLLLAATHVRGVRRAIALFLVVYCMVASVTETGLGDASPYLLDMVVAGSLLAAPLRRPV